MLVRISRQADRMSGNIDNQGGQGGGKRRRRHGGAPAMRNMNGGCRERCGVAITSLSGGGGRVFTPDAVA